MLEIVEGERFGGCGCTRAYTRLTAGCMRRGLVSIRQAGGRNAGVDTPPMSPGCLRPMAALSSGNCGHRMLAEGFQTTRLETRTKEYNMHASRRVANPVGASNLTGGMACACTINRP